MPHRGDRETEGHKRSDHEHGEVTDRTSVSARSETLDSFDDTSMPTHCSMAVSHCWPGTATPPTVARRLRQDG